MIMDLTSYPTPLRPTRKLLRLQTHSYSQPASYFVTICTHQKRCSLSWVNDGQLTLTPAGHIVRQSWYDLPNRFPHVIQDAFVIMPNHIHAILFVGAGLAPPGVNTSTELAHTPKASLSGIVGAFKSISTLSTNRLSQKSGDLLWQRSYYEHIIRDAEDMINVQRYILENPMRWELDPENTKPTYVSSPSAAQL
jgi:putative transposase